MLSLSTVSEGAAKRNLLRNYRGSGIICFDRWRETVELRDSVVAVDQDAVPLRNIFAF
ncbi:MAG: hypothetical protein L0220_24335 [Acidobacteria bacterium]|nr:hypothetical protein [Acidobacteriota bacterium]